MALFATAAALGFGHRESPDCPHCEILSLDRRRHVDRAVASLQSRSLVRRQAIAAPSVSAPAVLPATRPIPATLVPDLERESIAWEPPNPGRSNARDNVARAPPCFA